MGGAISNENQPLVPGFVQVLQLDGTLVPLNASLPQPVVVSDSYFGNNSVSSPAQPGQCVATLHVGCGVGGAIHGAYGGLLASTVTSLSRCVFVGNAASNAGGALAVSTLSAVNCSFVNNTVASASLAGEVAGGGGGVQASGVYVDTLYLENVSFVGNSAPDGPGGGLYAVYALSPDGEAGPVGVLNRVSFVGNSAGGGGGGFFATGLPLSVSSLSCVNNTATGGDGGCASLAGLGGGGADVSGAAAGNAAPAGTGGAFALDGASPLRLRGASLDRNSAVAGGAVGVAAGGGAALVSAAGGSSFTSNLAVVGAVFSLSDCGPAHVSLANVSAVAGNAATVSGGVAFCASAVPLVAGAAPPSGSSSSLPCGGACVGLNSSASNTAPNSNGAAAFPAATFAPSPAAVSCKSGALPPLTVAVVDAAGGGVTSLPGLTFSATIVSYAPPPGAGSAAAAAPTLGGSTLATFANGSATFDGLVFRAPPGASAVLAFTPSGDAPTAAAAAAVSAVASPFPSRPALSYVSLTPRNRVALTVAPCAAAVEAFDAPSLACVCASGAAATLASTAAAAADATRRTSACAACPPGAVAAQGSSLGCAACGVGTYPAAGGAACAPCPPGSGTPGGVGGASAPACACLPGYTRVPGGNATTDGPGFTCAQAAGAAPLLSPGGAGGVAAAAAVVACLVAAAVIVHVRRLRAAAAAARAGGWVACVASRDDIVLGAKLGSGGSATVYSATWRGAPVAIKEFDRGMAFTTSGGGDAAGGSGGKHPTAPGVPSSATSGGGSSPSPPASAASHGRFAWLRAASHSRGGGGAIASPTPASFHHPPPPSAPSLLSASRDTGNSTLEAGGVAAADAGAWAEKQVARRGVTLRAVARGPPPPPDDGCPSFAREVEFLSKLRHPNILAVYAVAPSPRPWLVMELGAAGSLRSLLRRTSLATLPWLSRVQLGAGAAAGVAFLHDQKPPIIHKDLKSENILLDAALVPKVGDFGISSLAHEPAGTQGTPRFMAPELFNPPGGPLDMTKVDVFGLGFVLKDLASVGTCASSGAEPPPHEPPPHAPLGTPTGATTGATTGGGSHHPLSVIVRRAKGGWEVSLPAGLDDGFASLLAACLAAAPGERPSALAAGARLRDMAALSVAWGPTRCCDDPDDSDTGKGTPTRELV